MAEAGKPDRRQAAEDAEMRVGWRMAGIGMQVASEVAAGVLLGWLFDYWRGHGTIGVIIGACAGIGVALWSLIRNALRLNRELDRTAPTAGRGKPLNPPSKDPTPTDSWDEAEGKSGDALWNNDDVDDDWPQHKRGG